MKVIEEALNHRVFWDGQYSHARSGVMVSVGNNDGGNRIWEKSVFSSWGSGRHIVPLFAFRRRRALKKANRILMARGTT